MLLRRTLSSWCFFVRHLHLRCSLLLAQNHYEVLGVERSAPKEDIRASFVTLSKKYHPDLNPGLKNANKAFIEVNEAYAVLSSPLKRQEYDRVLHTLDSYSAQYANRNYAGSAARRSGVPFGDSGTINTRMYYAYDMNEVDWATYRRASQRPNHARVIRFLILFMVVGSAVHTFRIRRAHRIHQERSNAESRRNYSVYAEVRERARASSVHEQLDRLSRRHSETLQKIASKDSGK